MSKKNFYSGLSDSLESMKQSGLFKSEFAIFGEQSANIIIDKNSQKIPRLNLCANNYLGLANDKRLIDQAKASLDNYGFGMSSVRFICGTSVLHKQLESRIADFLSQEDCILYSSCFDANAGLFETILSAEDAIVSDSLNHASIIDGVRLCKAKRYRYENNNMQVLENCLKQAQSDGAKTILIATDGVFSMDGIIANLSTICDLAEKYDALVMVDESHATGVVGKTGRGAIEYCDVMSRVDIVTSTFGKALGGASGGFTVGRAELVQMLRQKSRPYLFSNALAPMITSATLGALDIVEKEPERLDRLHDNARFFRESLEKAGFELAGAGHPIVPVMIGDEVKAKQFSDLLSENGIMAVNFSFPVVPKGKARIRTQMSSALTKEDLEKAISSFIEVGQQLEII